MKSFQQKKEELAKIKDKIAKSKLLIFSSFSRAGEKGLSVAEMRELKKSLKMAEAEYVISKKTLFNKAIGESKKNVDVSSFDGSLGLVFGYGDEQAAAKTVYGFSRKHTAMKYFGAVWGDKILDFAAFTEFAKLPAKEVMIARLLGMMKYPISALANVLDQVSKKRAV